MRPAFFLVFIVLGLAACAVPPASSDRIPEIEAFRAELADPARHPLRHGLAVDEKALRDAIEGFAVSHRELLDSHFRATLDALPAGQPPTAASHGLVAAVEGADAAPFADVSELYYRVDPDVKRVARAALGMVAPIMAQRTGLAIATIGPWMTFLTAATPKVSACDRKADRVVVCLDYGNLDIFLVTFTTRPTGWAVAGVTWRQLGRGEPAPAAQ